MSRVGAKPSKAELAKMKEQGQATGTEKKDAKPSTDKMAATAELSAQDSKFIQEAAMSGMKEVERSKMALKMAKSPGVKKVAEMMVAEHTKANNELMGLAKAKGVKLEKPAKMNKMSADNFDSVYLTAMMSDHQAAIALFETEAKKGKDAQTKAWAKKMLPALKQHLQMIKKEQGSVTKASRQRSSN